MNQKGSNEGEKKRELVKLELDVTWLSEQRGKGAKVKNIIFQASVTGTVHCCLSPKVTSRTVTLKLLFD